MDSILQTVVDLFDGTVAGAVCPAEELDCERRKCTMKGREEEALCLPPRKMKETGLISSPPMVRGILEDRKSQTRRVIRQAMDRVKESANAVCHIPVDDSWVAWWGMEHDYEVRTEMCYPYGGGFKCPYGGPGDRLYVKERWAMVYKGDKCKGDGWDGKHDPKTCLNCDGCMFEYYADTLAPYPGNWPPEEAKGNPDAPKWRSSMFMPKAAARIWLEITSVRVQRVQEINSMDINEEGIRKRLDKAVVDALQEERKEFTELWDSLNAKRGYGWDKNVWVWAIEFRRTRREGRWR